MMHRRRNRSTMRRLACVTRGPLALTAFLLIAAPSAQAADCGLGFIGAEFDSASGAWLDGPHGVALNPAGTCLYEVSFEDDALNTFSVNPDGDIEWIFTLRRGSNPDGLNGATEVAVSPDGDHVYVAGGQDNAVGIFERYDATCNVRFRDCLRKGSTMGQCSRRDVTGLKGASGVAVSEDGQCVYVTGRNDDSLVALSRNSESGLLTYRATYTGLNGASSVAVSSDSARVYTTADGDLGVVDLFERTSGCELQWVWRETNGSAGVHCIGGASAVAVSPDSAHVYVTGAAAGEGVAVFSQNAIALDFVECESVPNGADGVAVSPDGQTVYVTSETGNMLYVYGREASTGKLTQYASQGNTGTNGLAGARGVAVDDDPADPTSDRIYVASSVSDAVAIFSELAPLGTECEPGQQCTDDECDGIGNCVFIEFSDTNDSCNDGIACTLHETCDGAGGCGDGTCQTETECECGNGIGACGYSSGTCACDYPG